MNQVTRTVFFQGKKQNRGPEERVILSGMMSPAPRRNIRSGTADLLTSRRSQLDSFPAISVQRATPEVERRMTKLLQDEHLLQTPAQHITRDCRYTIHRQADSGHPCSSHSQGPLVLPHISVTQKQNPLHAANRSLDLSGLRSKSNGGIQRRATTNSKPLLKKRAAIRNIISA